MKTLTNTNMTDDIFGVYGKYKRYHVREVLEAMIEDRKLYKSTV